MLIGIDMVALQSPETKGRGIGRYLHTLLHALIRHDDRHHYFLYYYEGFPRDQWAPGSRVSCRVLPVEWDGQQAQLGSSLQRLVDDNPDRLDLFLVPSPFEGMSFHSHRPPARPLNGLKLGAILHDFIPFLFREAYLSRPAADHYYSILRTLGRYDVFLADSEATRKDSKLFLNNAQERVFNIGCPIEDDYFVAAERSPPGHPKCNLLESLGVDKPFVFNVGGPDRRKNWQGLIEAFGLLPATLRQTHQLVLTFGLSQGHAETIRSHASRQGVADRLVITGPVPDATLRALYRECAVFVFPSFYEGFGLPILEAMSCGAPVIAADNSSQPEVIGTAGLLAPAGNSAAMGRQIRRVLEEPGLAERMRRQSLIQARTFRRDVVARRALEVLEAAVRPSSHARVSAPRPRPRPRVAFFSPLPPQRTGIADYSVSLLRELKGTYNIDLYHDAGRLPHLAHSDNDHGCFDYRAFDRRAAILGYRGILYQMGNSHCHRFIYETMLRHPGIVTLHDFTLADFHYWYDKQPDAPDGHWHREIAYSSPAQASEVKAHEDVWRHQPGGVPRACTRRGIYLNRRVFEHALRVIVHDPGHLAAIGAMSPVYQARTCVVPQGADALTLSSAERLAVRGRFDVSADALVVAAFGLLTEQKMNAEAVTAFAALARIDRSALLLFVGEERDSGLARVRVAALGLGDRVRFLGHQPMSEFVALAGITDIGLNLRRPPTDGETSASLLGLMRAGVASIAIDVGTFASYPDDVLRKVHWSECVTESLTEALVQLGTDPLARARLGRAALDYIQRHHSWARAASLYAQAIEECAGSLVHRAAG